MAKGMNSSCAIPAGALDEALNRFAREAGINLSATPAQTRGLSTQGLNGTYSAQAGLAQLLDGTSLQAENLGGGSFVLRDVPA